MEEDNILTEADGTAERMEPAAAPEADLPAAPEASEPAVQRRIAVVNVRFRNRGKAYFFAPNGFNPQAGQAVVVETSKGLELGDCVEGIHSVPESSVVPPLRPVVRIATKEDVHVGEMNRIREKTAFSICEDKIRAHGLDMKLVDVEYSFEGGKILFFFTSDGRVDFRELVKDLAGVFHTRIELRQIGVRDGAKMLGGLGICGRPFCCSTFLEEFQPVSIRMAKTQSLSLNPTKISGTCGRLMCCLKYEQDAYEHLIKTMPRVDAQVDTPKGPGSVTEVNLLRRTVKVRLADAADNAVQSYPVDRLGYTLNGEYVEPLPEEEKIPEPVMPDLSLYMADKPEDTADARPPRNEHRRNRRPKNHGPRPDGQANREEWKDAPAEKPARSAEPREKTPRPDFERKKGGHDRGPRQHGAPGGEQKSGDGQHRDSRPPKEARPAREQNRGPRPEGQQPRADAAPKSEKKTGGSFNKHRYYHRDKKKPGGEGGSKQGQ